MNRKSTWLPKVNQSSSPNSATSTSTSTRVHVEDKSPFDKPKKGSHHDSGETRGISSVKSVSKWSDLVSPPNVSYKASSAVGNFRSGEGPRASVGHSPGKFKSPSSNLDRDENSDLGVGPSNEKLEEQMDQSSKALEAANPGNKQDQASEERMEINGGFDIFKTAPVFQLKTPLHLKNREKRQENKLSVEGPTIKVLRPGMVLLKHYISVADQVRIVETCRKLGLQGPRGFYQLFHSKGGKLNRKMMILGRNWDHQKNKYVDVNPIDGLIPLPIPGEFLKFSDQAMQASHDHLRKQSIRDVENTLPPLTPDVCVVNFYSKSSRLGLHQDRNESKESLRKGLPVVSISVGDSAEFAYGDQGDLDMVEKVVLESGDVLIFGGRSRLVYHGVTSIKPDTAPKVLLDQTNLHPGRLNLTFRQSQ